MASNALDTFRRSMSIGHMEWHEGIAYDLEALAALPSEERDAAEDLVVARQCADWRDIEVLASCAQSGSDSKNCQTRAGA